MGCVYRYTDQSDQIIKYVGIVWGGTRNLRQRVAEHARDPRFAKTVWRIEYIEANIDTRTDAEYFESHYIALYGTQAYLNEKKGGWGISRYLPDRESDWRVYDPASYHAKNPSLCIDNPAEHARHIFAELMACTTYAGRRSIYQSRLALHARKGDAKTYYLEVKRLMDRLLNMRLFGEDRECARFNGHGEILICLPLLGEVKFRDYDSCFVLCVPQLVEVHANDLVAFVNNKVSDIFTIFNNLQAKTAATR